MLKQMSVCLESIGFVSATNKVYNLSKELEFFPLVACLVSLSVLT